MHAHQLDANGVIINTIVVDSLDVIPGLIDATIGGGIGDSIIDGVLVPRETGTAPTPAAIEVSRRQGLQALYLAGVTEDMVLEYIGGMPDETARALALIEFKNATVFERHNPLVVAAGDHFDLDLDEIFATAVLM